MNPFFTSAEGSILVKLLLAHILADFLLQPSKWVKGKQEKKWLSGYLWLHGLITGLLTFLLLGKTALWGVVLLITVSHVLIDGIKVSVTDRKGYEKYSLQLFLWDQFLHIIILILAWLFIINGWQRLLAAFNTSVVTYRILLQILGYLIITFPVGIIIQFITRKWMNDVNTDDSLKDAGKWIGILERIITLTFIYTSQFAAIGFLITAKSVLRIIDKPDISNNEPGMKKPFSARKHTEYVLIGTFLSFAITIISGLIINWLLSF